MLIESTTSRRLVAESVQQVKSSTVFKSRPRVKPDPTRYRPGPIGFYPTQLGFLKAIQHLPLPGCECFVVCFTLRSGGAADQKAADHP